MNPLQQLLVFLALMPIPVGLSLIALRRARYSLAEFLVLMLLTGQAMAILGACLPKNTPWVEVVLAPAFLGAFLIMGGMYGLNLAQQLGIVSGWRRWALLLVGMPLLAGTVWAVVGWLPLLLLTLYSEDALPASVKWRRLFVGGLLWLLTMIYYVCLLVLEYKARRKAGAAEPRPAPPKEP